MNHHHDLFGLVTRHLKYRATHVFIPHTSTDKAGPFRERQTFAAITANKLSRYLIKIAQFGGYLARANDPPPGNTVI